MFYVYIYVLVITTFVFHFISVNTQYLIRFKILKFMCMRIKSNNSIISPYFFLFIFLIKLIKIIKVLIMKNHNY